MRNTKIYQVHKAMINRCCNKKDNNYHNYGGRGITVCNEWLNSFENFYNWSMANGYQKNLSIDRIDNNGNYEPTNCRWTTKKEQANNRRSNRLITHDGKIQTLKQWSEELKISYSTLKYRIKHNKSIDEVFSKNKIGGTND